MSRFPIDSAPVSWRICEAVEMGQAQNEGTCEESKTGMWKGGGCLKEKESSLACGSGKLVSQSTGLSRGQGWLWIYAMTKKGRVSGHGADWVKFLVREGKWHIGGISGERADVARVQRVGPRTWRKSSQGWSGTGPQSHQDFVFLILRGMGNTKGFLTGMRLSKHNHICILRQSILLYFGK